MFSLYELKHDGTFIIAFKKDETTFTIIISNDFNVNYTNLSLRLIFRTNIILKLL